jgi:hypothetical protein
MKIMTLLDYDVCEEESFFNQNKCKLSANRLLAHNLEGDNGGH